MNSELTPGEHAEMRDSILAGAQRLRSTGQRRMRVIAASVAFVLVAGISGGAVATAALLGSGIDDGAVATPTHTPTATPTPTSTPTETAPPPPPSEGVEPFGGECANVLTDDEVAAAAGIDMIRSDYRWKTGANSVLGGIDCVWVSEGVYLAATVHAFAYPASVVEQAVEDAPTGCLPIEGEGADVECVSARVVDGTWLQVRVRGAADVVTDAATVQLLSSAAARLGDYAAPIAADHQPDWWALPDCAQLLAGIDPAIYGYERVALTEQQSTTWYGDTRAESIPLAAGATFWCDLHFTAGEGDTSRGEVVTIAVVPGGAVAFPTAAGSEFAQPASVEGSQAAVVVPGLDRYEGSPSVLVVSDGVNILMLTPDWANDTAGVAPLAAVVLAMMHP